MLFGARAPAEAGRARRMGLVHLPLAALSVGWSGSVPQYAAVHTGFFIYLRYQRFSAACAADSCFQAKQKNLMRVSRKQKGPHFGDHMCRSTCLWPRHCVQVLDQHATRTYVGRG